MILRESLERKDVVWNIFRIFRALSVAPCTAVNNNF